MASQEQIETLLEALQKAPPSHLFQGIDSGAAGMRAILLYLSKQEGIVTAGMVSDSMNVSTARVAVLLKKMEAKGLIAKERDPEDARKINVKLSERGQALAAQAHEQIRTHVEAIIDQIGMERLLEFAAISKEIHAIVQPPEIGL